MRRILALGLLTLAATACKPPAPPATAMKLPPLPPAPAGDVVDTLHGVRIPDPDRWLETETSSATKAFMAAHDARARTFLHALPGRAEFEARAKALAYVDQRGAPRVRGPRRFWWSKPANREKGLWYWREGDGEARVLLDPMKMDPKGTTALGSVVPSPDGKFVAYLVKVDNADESNLEVMEVATGRVRRGDTIQGLRYTSPSWSADSQSFIYTWLPPEGEHPPAERSGFAEVRRHVLGQKPDEDERLRDATKDPTKFQGARYSEDGRWRIATVSRGWSEQEVFVTDGRGAQPWQRITPTDARALYDVEGYGDTLIIHTNEGAPRYRVLTATRTATERDAWKEIISEDEAAVIEDVGVVGGRLVVHRLRDARSELFVHGLDGTRLHRIELPMGRVTGVVGRADRNQAYFGFTGFDRPQEIWSLDVETGATELYHRPEVPFDGEQLVVEQVRYPSKDGTSVTMFLVRKTSAKKDGKQPTLLYGYGGFNISLLPAFSPFVVSWVEAGGIYAVANLRGGGEYGEAWHKAGMLGNKQNVFDDFIAAGAWLLKSGWTSTDHLGIAGRSNGGLLVGAAMTQRPDLFRAVLCGVPLLDMLRYQDFGIGRAWIPEYGTAERAEDFQWLQAYSPYHRVKPDVAYPALLMLSADHDDRVDPLHARKFVARIGRASVSEHPILLRIESNSGHGGGDLRSKRAERVADELAFLRSQLF